MRTLSQSSSATSTAAAPAPAHASAGSAATAANKTGEPRSQSRPVSQALAAKARVLCRQNSQLPISHLRQMRAISGCQGVPASTNSCCPLQGHSQLDAGDITADEAALGCLMLVGHLSTAACCLVARGRVSPAQACMLRGQSPPPQAAGTAATHQSRCARRQTDTPQAGRGLSPRPHQGALLLGPVPAARCCHLLLPVVLLLLLLLYSLYCAVLLLLLLSSVQAGKARLTNLQSVPAA